MAELKWTAEAERWLKDIHEYISHDNPVAADKVVSGIFEKAQLIKQHPEIGYKYASEQTEEIRILLYGHYRIAYLIRTQKQVDILGVFHGALDLDRYL